MNIWRYPTQCANYCKVCLVMPYSQFLVPWLILTNTVLDIAKKYADSTNVITHKNPWTIPNHRCPVFRGVPVFIILGAEVQKKWGHPSRMKICWICTQGLVSRIGQYSRIDEQQRWPDRKCDQPRISQLFVYLVVSSFTNLLKQNNWGIRPVY